VLVCAECGKENPEEARFCLACGAPFEAQPTRAREERKVVTVLFCDLVGFTSRSEQLDPEDVSAMLAPYHARLRAELERYGGTVEKFIGDAVMAVFGAPVAHEDDPERAVRAALAIRDDLREEGKLDVRIAVNTGEALVRLGARPQEGEGMVRLAPSCFRAQLRPRQGTVGDSARAAQGDGLPLVSRGRVGHPR
jgi:hypothetical protein